MDFFDLSVSSKDMTYSKGNTAVRGADRNDNQHDWRTAYGTKVVTSGQYFWKVKVTSYADHSGNFWEMMMGVSTNTDYGQKCDGGEQWVHCYYTKDSGEAYAYISEVGNKANTGGSSGYGATYGLGDVITISLDLDAGTISYAKNGVSQGVAYTGLAAGSYRLAIGVGTDEDSVEIVETSEGSEVGPQDAEYKLAHPFGCDQDKNTKLAQYDGIETPQECANKCIEHGSCEYFIYGKEGSNREHTCRLEMGNCVVVESWTNWDTYLVEDTGEPRGQFKDDTRFDLLHENGCKNQGKVTYKTYDEDIETCATDCYADANCDFFLHGKPGFDKKGQCSLGSGSCEYTSNKGNWRAFYVIRDDDLVNADQNAGAASEPTTVNTLALVGAVGGCVAAAVMGFFIFKKRQQTSVEVYRLI
jgi:hypothetical protein